MLETTYTERRSECVDFLELHQGESSLQVRRCDSEAAHNYANIRSCAWLN